MTILAGIIFVVLQLFVLFLILLKIDESRERSLTEKLKRKNEH